MGIPGALDRMMRLCSPGQQLPVLYVTKPASQGQSIGPGGGGGGGGVGHARFC